ncbi:glycoside hydrolase family 92 protein [Streptococcus sp. O1]|nr:glycoside hydrolase family 92 protein [Streptococcus sp. O1]
MKTILERIDTRYGSNNCHAYSNGNTLPYTGTPFGMNYFVPQTTDNPGNMVFNPTIPYFPRHTIDPPSKPLDWRLCLAFTDPCYREHHAISLYHRQSSYRPNKATFNPHHLAIHSERYQITTELTPTTYGACLKVNSVRQQELSLFLHSEKGSSFEQIDPYSLRGYVQDVTETTRKPITLYVHLRFDKPIAAVSQLETDTVIEFASPDIEVQLGTSYISYDQASFNTPNLPFEDCKNQAKEDWNHYLHRFDLVDDGGYDTRMFHHALYRTFLFPQTFYELDPKGQEIHLDLASNQVRLGKFLPIMDFGTLSALLFPFCLCRTRAVYCFLRGISSLLPRNRLLTKMART